MSKEIREVVIGLLDDFEEHANMIIEAKHRLEEAQPGSDAYCQALARIEVWMNGLTALVPGILDELEQLEDTADDD